MRFSSSGLSEVRQLDLDVTWSNHNNRLFHCGELTDAAIVGMNI